MNPSSKPLVTARWVDYGRQSMVEAVPPLRLALDPGEVPVLRHAYALASGRRTIAAMTARGLPLETLLRFFGGLERIGGAWEGRSASMAGHALGNNPGGLAPATTEEEVVALMALPADPPGPRLALEGRVADPDRCRSTVTRFSRASISLWELSAILLAAYGRVGEVPSNEEGPSFVRRTVPSAGALYPLRHDVFVLAGQGVAPGHYRLALHDNALIRLGETDRPALKRCLVMELAGAAAVHVISFDLSRSAAKYGPRAYRFALLEAGHAAQNAMRTAGIAGIGSFEFGGYSDRPLERLVGVSHSEAGIATVVLYGRPA